MSSLQVGSTRSLKGCVTEKGFLKGRTIPEIERILGFASGHLRNGAYICELVQLPAADQFEYAGYTQVATHRTKEQYGNVQLDKKVVYKNLLQKWSQGGNNTLVKVIAMNTPQSALLADEMYPPGSGAPQWVLTTPLPFKVVALLSGSVRY